MPEFDLAAARAYWRFTPSGRGKHDTSELQQLDDAALQAVWGDAFESRLRQYPEEQEFLRLMAGEFAGKRLLSIGSGLGFHDICYQRHGAHVTCYDIVASNLQVVERIAALKSAGDIRTVLGIGDARDIDGRFDVVFLYGSLMAVPEPLQRDILARCAAALNEGGTIVLMLYTWDFARATCGWRSPEEFDPIVFARASDPSASDVHCPWSDWHDDAKLLSLAPGMRITRRQVWNQGWFVWYELAAGREGEPARPFFDAAVASGRIAQSIPLGRFTPAAARMSVADDAIDVETEATNFSYALVAGPFSRDGDAPQPNGLLVDATIAEGAFSVGLLDEESGSFASAHAIWQPGSGSHVFLTERVPERFSVIVSNHRAGAAAASRFRLRRIALVRREPAVDTLGLLRS